VDALDFAELGIVSRMDLSPFQIQARILKNIIDSRRNMGIDFAIEFMHFTLYFLPYKNFPGGPFLELQTGRRFLHQAITIADSPLPPPMPRYLDQKHRRKPLKSPHPMSWPEDE
jgi:hypothetical protein